MLSADLRAIVLRGPSKAQELRGNMFIHSGDLKKAIAQIDDIVDDQSGSFASQRAKNRIFSILDSALIELESDEVTIHCPELRQIRDKIRTAPVNSNCDGKSLAERIAISCWNDSEDAGF